MEQNLFILINSFAGKSGFLDFLAVFFASYFGYILLAAALYAIFSLSGWKAKIRQFSFSALTIILSWGILSEFIRFFYDKPRPFAILEVTKLINHSANGSFPSGHAAFFFALSFSIFSLNKKFGWYLTASASAIGLARVFAGVHWPLDIAGGAAVAFFSFLIVEKYILNFKKVD